MLYSIAGKLTISKQLQFRLTKYIILCQISLYNGIIMLLIFY